MALDMAHAAELRRLAAAVHDAVEARIRGDTGGAERLRRSTQDVQMCGMGAFNYWSSQLWQPLKNVCLVMAQELGVLPALTALTAHIAVAEEGEGEEEEEKKKKKKGVEAVRLAEEIGADAGLVSRLLRVLTSVGIGEETAPDTYRANAVSILAGSAGGQAGVTFTNELLFQVAARLAPFMREHGFHAFPQRPAEMDVVQFTFNGRDMWQYLRDTPHMKDAFDTLMRENRRGNRPWFTIFPFAEEISATAPDDDDDFVLLVDVGGNRGADLLDFHRAHRTLPGRRVLQDLPETVARVDRTALEGIDVQAYDFFTPQPVRGATAYFWRWILHDWDDASIRVFLGHTVRAMGPRSRLLIEEFVLPDTAADVKMGHLDVLMMLYHSGMERTQTQWRTLLESCGVDVVKVWTRPDTDSSVLECRRRMDDEVGGGETGVGEE